MTKLPADTQTGTNIAGDEMYDECIVLPPAVARAIDSILAYLWAEEERDFHARTKKERTEHIFKDLFFLRAWRRWPEAKIRTS